MGGRRLLLCCGLSAPSCAFVARTNDQLDLDQYKCAESPKCTLQQDLYTHSPSL